VQAYIWGTSLVNILGIAKGLQRGGVSLSAPALLVFDQRVTGKQVIMTANSEVVYGLTVADLGETGPLVVETPAGLLGAVTDAWQRALVDIGIGGSAEGGRFLLLGPDHDDPDNIDEFIVGRSRTNLVQFGVRGVLKPGDSVEPFIEHVSATRIYPHADRDDPKPSTAILNGDRPFDSDWPKDFGYFEYLAEGLAGVAIEPEDKLMYAMLEPLGVVPGKPFQPDERQREILARAAETGAAMVSNMAFANRFPGRQMWPGRQWEHIMFATSPDFLTDQRVELDERAQGWYQLLGNQRFLYVAKPTPGVGTWYASTFRDASGDFLDGSNSYALSLPPDLPAKQFWSATVYDNRSRSMIDTDQGLAGLSSYSPLKKDDDGSTSLYFAPEAPDGSEVNWIKTIPGQGFFVMFRLYGPLEPVFDGSWQLNDIERRRT
jgi:hypothetical protein